MLFRYVFPTFGMLLPPLSLLTVTQILLKAGVSDRMEASAAMARAQMLDRRGSSHRLIAHLLTATKSAEQPPATAAAHEPLLPMSDPLMKTTSDSPKGSGSDSSQHQPSRLPKSASAEQSSALRPRRASSDMSPDKREKKGSGKARLSKGTLEGLPAHSKLVDRTESDGSERSGSPLTKDKVDRKAISP